MKTQRESVMCKLMGLSFVNLSFCLVAASVRADDDGRAAEVNNGKECKQL